jgi:tetraacyldisaccharide 4'-kinase
VPVISVGNLTTGGTGKTPIVCFLAKALRAKGVRVAIISRGYGRGDGDANDEAMELHDRLPDVPHIQDPDRVEAARIAVEELETQVILMDDGFQHRRLHRDLDIVVVDGTCPFGYGYLLPRGLLREPITSLGRADLVIISRCDVVSENEIIDIESTMRGIKPNIPILRSSHTPTTLVTFPNEQSSSDQLHGQDVAILSAIGNPGAFEKTVRGCGANVLDAKSLRDHDPYSPETVKELIEWARSLPESATRIVCTHKDLVKLRTDRLGGIPLQALLIDLTILSNTEALDAVIMKVLGNALEE